MAGIGFELKKLFKKKGLFSLLKAYGYAGIVCTGPMLLGMLLLLGVRSIAAASGVAVPEQELLNCMITYTLLASLVVTNCMSMITTRYVADTLYMEEPEMVMPSFYGSTAIMYVAGGILYGIFIAFSGVDMEYKLCCMILFMELVTVWSQINYLTAVKDYKGIMEAFAVAVAVALLGGYIFVKITNRPILTLFLDVILAYGIMMTWYYKLLVDYFPKGRSSSFAFLKWLDKYPQLVWVGTFMGIGLFGHLVLMWASPIGVQVKGLFYGAPQYDVPSLFAFVSILITTINFVTSVEVNFYPKYSVYFGLFNNGGTLVDIERAEEDMIHTLEKELGYTFSKQFFASVVFIVGGTLLIPKLPFGFNEEMLGIYRVLCVGYAFYAAGNCMMLMTLYFSDNFGAFLDTLVYAVSSIAGTLVFMKGDTRYYGFGFLIAGVIFASVSFIRLFCYINKLEFHVISKQPFTDIEISGFGSYISEKMEKRYEVRNGKKR